MEYKNSIVPNKEQLEGFQEPGPDESGEGPSSSCAERRLGAFTARRRPHNQLPSIAGSQAPG